MLVFLYFITLWVSTAAISADEDPSDAPSPAADPQDVETQARNAREAASSAKQAAHVANTVAAHSIDITHHAQSALKHARSALHGARVETSGLSSDQKEALRKAEEKLKKATQTADYGSLKDARYAGMSDGKADARLSKLQDKLDSTEGGESVSSMRSELRSLRERLAAKRLEDKVVDTKGTVSTEDDVSAEQMEAQLRDLETLVKQREQEGYKAKKGEPTTDEIKAEMEALRSGIKRLQGEEQVVKPQQLSAEDTEMAKLKARLAKYEKLKAGRAKEAEVRAALKKLRAMKARGEPIPEGAPTEEELEGLLKRLRSEDAALEKELGVKEGDDISVEVGRLRSRLGQKRTEAHGEEYGHLELDVGEKKKGKDSEDDRTVDLDGVDFERGDSSSKTLDSDRMVKMGKGRFDIDTEMPYGELEPFGREDTAQELTESSIKESDEMVDQLERAEVAEEKRSVFRALTRLRGAAITSFDGIARSQTGNIDEYNKTHKWRKTHPLHHLADEESDISKWAFPDNADF
jgi:hypothetical protein